MQRLRNLCENAAVPPHPAMMRALAALLSAFLMTPGAQAAEPEAPEVMELPGAAGPVRVVQPASTHLVALEPEAIKTVREAPPKSSHTALWIIASVLVTGAAAAGGSFLSPSSQTPATANVNATWSH